MIIQPSVSVIMSTHDVDQWVSECLSSILDDQDVDMEVIVIDDRSMDDTWKIVSKRAASDPRIRLVRSIGSGGAQARNLGVELARGEYIVFCDGDDLVPRGSYARMLACARATGADIVVGNFLKFWSTQTWRPSLKWPAFDEPRVGVTVREATSLIRNRACWNRMFRRQLWLDERIYFPSVPRSNDIVAMTKALVSASHIDVITEDVYLYRGRPGDGSMTSRAATLESYTSYLSQELECSALVTSLRDENLRTEYEELFLATDGWVHLRGFLKSMRDAVYDKESLERVREYLAAMLARVEARSLSRLPVAQRWIYALAVAGAWSAAGRLMRAIKPGDEPMPDGMWFLEQAAELSPSRILPEELLRKALNRWLIAPLAKNSNTALQDAPSALAAYADVFRRLYSDRKAVRELPTPNQQLVRALVTGREEVIRACFAEGLPQVRLESMAVRSGKVVLRAVVAGHRIDDLAFYASRHGERQDFRHVRSSMDTHTIEASISVAKLTAGWWSIRIASCDPESLLDVGIAIPSKVVTQRGHRWSRAVIRSQADSKRGGMIVVRHHVFRRAAHRTTKVAKRVVLGQLRKQAG